MQKCALRAKAFRVFCKRKEKTCAWKEVAMNVVCLDLEGVLVPEIWIAFAEATNIPELKKTTRDEPDYDKLMNYRLGILKEHGLGLKEIQDVIATIDPMPGAKEFLDELRELTQVIIISDTFTQFAQPLMKKLGWPTLFCNELEVAEDGTVTGFKMRCEQSKLTTVQALHQAGLETIAAGDSFNDLGMIKASKAGFLFKSTDSIKADNPTIPAFEEYAELMAGIKAAL
jgi:phosphoserine/homoserine phosphotransferase